MKNALKFIFRMHLKHLVDNYFLNFLKAPNKTKVKSEGYTSYPYDVA
jgi:hypothetical protein